MSGSRGWPARAVRRHPEASRNGPPPGATHRVRERAHDVHHPRALDGASTATPPRRRHRHRQWAGRPFPCRAPRRGRPQGGADRARAPGRHLRQRWLHADQDARRQRTRRTCRAPRGALGGARRGHRERRHEGREGAQGRGGPAVGRQPHALARCHCEPRARARPRPLRRRARGRGERRATRCAPGLHQRRRPPRAACMAGHRRGPGVDEHLRAAAGRAAGSPAGGRRQLHRPGVRADLSPLRRTRHGGRGGRADHRPRRPRDLARGAGAAGGRRHRVPPRRARRAREPRRRWGRCGHRADVPHCCRRPPPRRHSPAGRRRPTPEHRRPGVGSHRPRHRRPRLHPGRRRTAHGRRRHLGAGRCQRPRCLHAHVVSRSRDRRSGRTAGANPIADCCDRDAGPVPAGQHRTRQPAPDWACGRPRGPARTPPQLRRRWRGRGRVGRRARQV